MKPKPAERCATPDRHALTAGHASAVTAGTVEALAAAALPVAADPEAADPEAADPEAAVPDGCAAAGAATASVAVRAAAASRPIRHRYNLCIGFLHPMWTVGVSPDHSAQGGSAPGGEP